MKVIVTNKQLQLIREISDKEFSCEKCDHSWEIDKDDTHPYLCHMCGYESSKNKYNLEELEKFWKNYKKENITEGKKDPLNLSKKDMKSLIDQGKKHMGYSEEEAKEEIESIIQSIKKLPSEIKLFRIVRADDRKDIDTKTPGSHYAKNKKDLLSSHSFADGVGDFSFMITVLAPKELMDIDQTIYNNLLYPNENEVTLKNKGEGVKIVSIRKIANQKEVNEKWSEKYKRSINCNNPEGFSQKAHCQGRKKRLKEDSQKEEIFKETVERDVNEYASNYEWCDGIEINIRETNWLTDKQKPVYEYGIKFKDYSRVSYEEQENLFDDIMFVHTMYFPVENDVVCYLSVKSVFPNGVERSFPNIVYYDEIISEAIYSEDNLKKLGYDIDKIKEALLIASKLSTTFGEGIPLEFKLYGYYFFQSDYTRNRLDLFIDVNSEDGVYNTNSDVWHDISMNILDLFSMIGIRDEKYMKPLYDFKFNKRPLYDIKKV
jgi:hypothetical protein